MSKHFRMTLVASAVIASFGTSAMAATYVSGDTEYDSLQAAFSGVADGGTITLGSDVADGSGSKTMKGTAKTFTLDLNKHTYTFAGNPVGSSGTETQGFQLLKGNTVTIKNGTLNVAPQGSTKFAMDIQNYSNLTLENVVVDGSNLPRGGVLMF